MSTVGRFNDRIISRIVSGVEHAEAKIHGPQPAPAAQRPAPRSADCVPIKNERAAIPPAAGRRGPRVLMVRAPSVAAEPANPPAPPMGRSLNAL